MGTLLSRIQLGCFSVERLLCDERAIVAALVAKVWSILALTSAKRPRTTLVPNSSATQGCIATTGYPLSP